MKKWMGFLICIILLAGCGTEKTDKGSGEKAVNTQPEKNGVLAEALTAGLMMKEKKDGDYHFEYTVENKTGKTIHLVFNSGQKFDYILKDKAGKVFKQDSEGKMYTQAIVEKDLDPGARLSYDIYLKGLEPGDYTLEAWLTSSSEKSDHKEKITFKVE